MPLADNLLVGVFKLLNFGLWIYMWLIIARVVVSWTNLDPYHPAVRFLISTTEPVLYAIRRRLPLQYGGLDFTPILVIFLIAFLRSLLAQLVFSWAAHLG